MPSPYHERASQEAEWRRRFTEEETKTAEVVLGLVCDSFCFNPEERLKFGPDDRLLEIYRSCYPPSRRWFRGDCMEVETLLLLLDEELGVPDSAWREEITIGEVVTLAASKETWKNRGAV
jgi:hypothetical protein